MGLFTALNNINTLSPAYDVMEMQEMKWPFVAPGMFKLKTIKVVYLEKIKELAVDWFLQD